MDNIWQYDYQRPLGKIDDNKELRNAFIEISDTKTKTDLVRFGLIYGGHLIDIANVRCERVQEAFDTMQEWLDGKTSYHKARNIVFSDLWKAAQSENDLIRERFYKTMAQIACIPHVKFHALWASDFAITLINKMHPSNINEVRNERETQIKTVKNL